MIKLISTKNNPTVKELEEICKHAHDFRFYDNHDDTFDTLRKSPLPRSDLPIGRVYMCECGAREIRFIVWTGKHDPRR